MIHISEVFIFSDRITCSQAVHSAINAHLSQFTWHQHTRISCEFRKCEQPNIFVVGKAQITVDIPDAAAVQLCMIVSDFENMLSSAFQMCMWGAPLLPIHEYTLKTMDLVMQNNQ